jgi:ABC-type transporter Mla subunit MlaD
MLAFSFGDLVDVALATFLFLVGIGIAFVSLRLGGTLQRLSAFIRGTQDEVLPVISKVGTTVDHVNAQMEKVDQITDSAVDAADSADTAVRAVSMAVTRPVQKIAGVAAGVTHGFADLKVHRSWRSAVDAAKEAAAAREQELAEELRDAGKNE